MLALVLCSCSTWRFTYIATGNFAKLRKQKLLALVLCSCSVLVQFLFSSGHKSGLKSLHIDYASALFALCSVIGRSLYYLRKWHLLRHLLWHFNIHSPSIYALHNVVVKIDDICCRFLHRLSKKATAMQRPKADQCPSLHNSGCLWFYLLFVQFVFYFLYGWYCSFHLFRI